MIVTYKKVLHSDLQLIDNHEGQIHLLFFIFHPGRTKNKSWTRPLMGVRQIPWSQVLKQTPEKDNINVSHWHRSIFSQASQEEQTGQGLNTLTASAFWLAGTVLLWARSHIHLVCNDSPNEREPAGKGTFESFIEWNDVEIIFDRFTRPIFFVFAIESFVLAELVGSCQRSACSLNKFTGRSALTVKQPLV